ncbi:hypothetical protein NJC38_04240 [Pseudomonas sp. 21LCFQ010]|uniref:hypothetical protein n=1 Tax=Pseudomonas sp. 21LCFQ010 TaxID=2957506 RepID=UPI002097C9D9|nr:hypothetical protein [Pseudomonas sp. 21LCFQ010]MCO8161362.1 hypothetical protein [Pseudomonas sp. 21LCFQ010]
MKRKSIRFSIASLTGTLTLGIAALPGSSLVGLLPGVAGLLLIWLAASRVVRRPQRQAEHYEGIADAMNLIQRLPHTDVNADALRPRMRNLADQANLLALNSAIHAATRQLQGRDVTQTPGRTRPVVPRQDDTDPIRLAEQQRRLINQFKV